MEVENKKGEPWFFQTQNLLQQAYNLDEGLPSSLSKEAILNFVDQLGPLVIHRVFYDGGISSFPEIAQLLKDKPQGVLATVMSRVRDLRVANGDYSRETLNRMYGLS